MKSDPFNQNLLYDQPAGYLRENREMNVSHPLIQHMAGKLTGHCASDVQRAVQIFYFIRDEISYNMYPKDNTPANYYASRVLENQEGWCLPKSLLAVTLYRAVGIPARICFAELINHSLGQKAYDAIGTNHFSPHTYVEIYLQDQWLPITPVFDAPLCKRLQVPVVEFDGHTPAMLEEKDLNGNPYMEYLSKTPAYERLPWEYAVGEIRRVYKERGTIWFSENFLEEKACGK